MESNNNQLLSILQEDLILRPPTVKYTLKMFSDVLTLIKTIQSEGTLDSIEGEINKFHEKNAQSPISLFSYIVLQTYKNTRSIEPSLEKLFTQLQQHKKQAIVIFIAKELLEIRELPLLLKTLSNYYQREGENDSLIEIWNKMISRDQTDYELPKKLADLYVKAEEEEEANRYYKISFNRAYEAKVVPFLMTLWKTILKRDSSDHQFFHGFAKKLETLIGKTEAHAIKKELFDNYFIKFEENIDICIELAKEILIIEDDNVNYKRDLVRVYREKYKNHSLLEEFLHLSGLNRHKRNIPHLVEIFEKHITFDKDCFVHHETFGFGVVKEIKQPISKKIDPSTGTKIVIDFEKKKLHPMTLRIALTSLTIENPDNIIALALFKKDFLLNKIANEKSWLIPAIFKTKTAEVSAAEIKSMFVPNAVSADDWNGFWKTLKELLENDSSIEFTSKSYKQVSGGGSYKELLLKQFHKTKSVLQKIKTAETYLLDFKTIDTLLQEMLATIEKSLNGEHDTLVCFYLLSLKKSKGWEPSVSLDDTLNRFFAPSVTDEEILKRYESLPYTTYKRMFLEILFDKKGNDISSVAKLLFYSNHTETLVSLVEKLVVKNETNLIAEFIKTLHLNKFKYAEHYSLLARYAFLVEDKIVFDKGKTFPDLIQILYVAHTDLEETGQKTLEGHSKKIFNSLINLFFEEGILFDYLKNDDSKELRKSIFEQLEKLSFLDNYIKVELSEIKSKI